MAKLAIAIAVALAFASLQCVTLCAAPATPPCPHHQKTVDSCAHELVYLQAPAIVPAPSIQASLAASNFSAEPTEPAPVSPFRIASPPLRL
jgi:hypothetical protein